MVETRSDSSIAKLMLIIEHGTDPAKKERALMQLVRISIRKEDHRALKRMAEGTGFPELSGKVRAAAKNGIEVAQKRVIVKDVRNGEYRDLRAICSLEEDYSKPIRDLARRSIAQAVRNSLKKLKGGIIGDGRDKFSLMHELFLQTADRSLSRSHRTEVGLIWVRQEVLSAGKKPYHDAKGVIYTLIELANGKIGEYVTKPTKPVQAAARKALDKFLKNEIETSAKRNNLATLKEIAADQLLSINGAEEYRIAAGLEIIRICTAAGIYSQIKEILAGSFHKEVKEEALRNRETAAANAIKSSGRVDKKITMPLPFDSKDREAAVFSVFTRERQNWCLYAFEHETVATDIQLSDALRVDAGKKLIAGHQRLAANDLRKAVSELQIIIRNAGDFGREINFPAEVRELAKTALTKIADNGTSEMRGKHDNFVRKRTVLSPSLRRPSRPVRSPIIAQMLRRAG